MDAIILAGGLGTRLREVLADKPKPLAPIRGRPFLDLLLDQLQGKVERVILAVGYKAEAIKGQYGSKQLLFSEEKTPLGTGGALKQALTFAKGSPVLVLNGDSYFDIRFDDFFAFHQRLDADVTLACRAVEDVSRYGSLQIDKEGKIIAFQEKKPLKEPGWINGGIYLIHPPLLHPFSGVFSLEKDFFPSLLKKKMFAYLSSEKFIDIGTKESYLKAQEIL